MEKKKLTYEELQTLAGSLSSQLQNLQEAYQKINYTNVFKRLDYLFLVVQNKDFFDKSFVSNIKDEIQSLLKLENEDENK